MDIKARQADGFVRKVPPNVTAVLLYGADAGLVSERAERIARAWAADPKVPGEILRLSDTDLQEAPDRLAVELRNLSMFGDRKIVRLMLQSAARPELVTELIEGPPLAGLLVVEAGNLRADSKLRKVFAGAGHAAAVACYPDDEDAIGQLIRDVLGAHKLGIGKEARTYLIGRLGADRALSRAEIEKLALYCLDRPEVTVGDIDAVTGDASELAVDRILKAAFAGKPGPALRELERAIASGESPQTVLLFIERHILRLMHLRTAIDGGRTPDEAVRALRPPPHFSEQAALAQQGRTWTTGRLQTALRQTSEAIRTARLRPRLEPELVDQLVARLALGP
ncbi:MAG: DNA polymerase III subunit delta [Hyphomicrobiaceae bacterium]